MSKTKAAQKVKTAKCERTVFDALWTLRQYFGVERMHFSGSMLGHGDVSWTWNVQEFPQLVERMGLRALFNDKHRIIKVVVELHRWETYQESRQWMRGHSRAKKLLEIINAFPERAFQAKIVGFVEGKNLRPSEKYGQWKTLFEGDVRADNMDGILDCQVQGVGKVLSITLPGDLLEEINGIAAEAVAAEAAEEVRTA